LFFDERVSRLYAAAFLRAAMLDPSTDD